MSGDERTVQVAGARTIVQALAQQVIDLMEDEDVTERVQSDLAEVERVLSPVPVSRVRDTVDSALQQHSMGILLPLQDHEFTAIVEDVTAAVLALLSQPTPAPEQDR